MCVFFKFWREDVMAVSSYLVAWFFLFKKKKKLSSCIWLLPLMSLKVIGTCTTFLKLKVWHYIKNKVKSLTQIQIFNSTLHFTNYNLTCIFFVFFIKKPSFKMKKRHPIRCILQSVEYKMMDKKWDKGFLFVWHDLVKEKNWR